MRAYWQDSEDWKAKLNKARAMFDRAANSNHAGEAFTAARMGFAFAKKFSITLEDLLRTARGNTEREYVRANFQHARKVWEAQDKARAEQARKAKDGAKTEQTDGEIRKVWVAGYTRKDGREVKGYWRTVKAGASKCKEKQTTGPNGEQRDGFTWVTGYTRKDGREVRGYWRKAR